MACLALSLQPTKGPDILLQTREWFPPARALVALSSFRSTRLAFASGKSSASDDGDQSLGDDPLAASSGQVIVGKESKYRIVYRLVNSIYVLGITSADQDETVNVFECTGIVNQAVSVVVAACRGVDVTPDKLHRKYTEIYMALDMVLRGVSSIRLANILSSMHGEGIAKMVLYAIDAENRARGADGWNQVEGQSLEHQANVQVLSQAMFELPEETLSAGDEVAATLAPAPQTSTAQASQQQLTEKPANEDPFAVSDAVNKPVELSGGFKKNKEAMSDVTAALAELDVTTLKTSSKAESTFIGVEGFEGDYGGLEFGNEQASLSETFEGLDDAFGGGLDASEFGATIVAATTAKGLGGLELLESGQTASKTSTGTNLTPGEALTAAMAPANKGPLLYLQEEISAEFKESVLKKIGLQGTLFLKTTSPKDSSAKDTEFSFRLDGAAGIKSAIMQDAIVSSLGKSLFHIRTSASEDPMTILKYRLQPRFTPLPLRIRLIKRRSGTLLSLMIQYVANPFLPAPLKDVIFTVKLPEDPTLLKVSPKATLNRQSQELRWHVQEIQLQGRPGCLRAQMPVESVTKDSKDKASHKKEIEIRGRVEFAVQGHTLSGITVSPVSEGLTDFSLGETNYKTGNYLCS